MMHISTMCQIGYILHIDRTQSSFLANATVETGPLGPSGIACRLNFYLYLGGTGIMRKHIVYFRLVYIMYVWLTGTRHQNMVIVSDQRQRSTFVFK